MTDEPANTRRRPSSAPATSPSATVPPWAATGSGAGVCRVTVAVSGVPAATESAATGMSNGVSFVMPRVRRLAVATVVPAPSWTFTSTQLCGSLTSSEDGTAPGMIRTARTGPPCGRGAVTGTPGRRVTVPPSAAGGTTGPNTCSCGEAWK